MVKESVHHQKDIFSCLCVAPLQKSVLEFGLLFIVAAVEQFLGAHIFSVGAAAVFGRENAVPYAAGGKQEGKNKQHKYKTESFHGQ